MSAERERRALRPSPCDPSVVAGHARGGRDAILSLVHACVVATTLLASSTALGDASGDRVASFAVREVARVAVGTGIDEISNRGCTGSERFCSAGLAFLGIRDTLLFYDVVNANLKVVAISKPRGGLVRLIPGPSTAGEWDEVLDGTTGSDGTVYLLQSTRLPSPRVRVCSWPPGAAGWVEGPALDAGSFGLSPPASSDRAAPGRWSLLVSLADGTIALCSQSRQLGTSLLVADRQDLGVGSRGVALDPGVPLAGGRRLVLRDHVLAIEAGPGGPHHDLVGPGVFVGTDRDGSVFIAGQSSWSRRVLERYDVEGRRVGSAELPERPVWKPVTGKGDLVVTSGGDVLEILVSDKWLTIYRWTMEG